MEPKLYLYTSDGCPGCESMKAALARLGIVRYTEIKLTTGRPVPPDVRGLPTLSAEKDGKRTTICQGWPGSIDQLKKTLRSWSCPKTT